VLSIVRCGETRQARTDSPATLLAITVPIAISSLTGLILGYNKKLRPPGPLGRAMS